MPRFGLRTERYNGGALVVLRFKLLHYTCLGDKAIRDSWVLGIVDKCRPSFWLEIIWILFEGSQNTSCLLAQYKLRTVTLIANANKIVRIRLASHLIILLHLSVRLRLISVFITKYFCVVYVFIRYRVNSNMVV